MEENVSFGSLYTIPTTRISSNMATIASIVNEKREIPEERNA